MLKFERLSPSPPCHLRSRATTHDPSCEQLLVGVEAVALLSDLGASHLNRNLLPPTIHWECFFAAVLVAMHPPFPYELLLVTEGSGPVCFGSPGGLRHRRRCRLVSTRQFEGVASAYLTPLHGPPGVLVAVS